MGNKARGQQHLCIWYDTLRALFLQYWSEKKSFPVKIKGNCYIFDTTESENGIQTALSPTNYEAEGIILKNSACNRK
jgi:hypothetical protein